MRRVLSGLVLACALGIALGVAGEAEARGGRGGGPGVAAGGRPGFVMANRGRQIGHRGFGAGRLGDRRFGFGTRGFGRYGGYGLYGGTSVPWGAPGYDLSYGRQVFGSVQPTSIGIPAPPVAPPAIYVLGGSSNRAAIVTGRGRSQARASRALTVDSSESGESGVVAAPRVIRVAR